MNKVILTGRLTRDPFTSNSGQRPIAKFTLACDRSGEGADYPNCVAWGKTAEVIAKYLRKGSNIAIEGRISTGSYQKDGETIYTTDVAVSRMEFLDTKGGDKKSGEKPAQEADFEAVNEDAPF